MAATPPVEAPTHAGPKRSRSPDSLRSGSSTPVPGAVNGKAHAETVPLPKFLSQSLAEIHIKFDELQQRQMFRLLQGQRAGEGGSQFSQDPSTRAIRLRNRYLDIYPWAASRIRLRVPEGGCDYINASPISLRCSTTGREFRYIAAQGPKALGVNDFWQMVWHETADTAVIIMLTTLLEGPREKCAQYYPDDLDANTLDLTFLHDADDNHDPCAQARLISRTVDEATKSTIRHIELVHDSRIKTVWHLSFLGWPDQAVPDEADGTRAALLRLVALSREKNPDVANPTIVHCSAGCGRTGTFIALEHLLGELHSGAFAAAMHDHPRRDPVFEAVNRLREQRMVMVQTAEQLAFLYGVLRNEYVKVQLELQQQQRALEAQRAAAEVAAAAGMPTPPPSTDAKKAASRSGEPLFKSMKLSRNLKKLPSFLRRTHSERAAGGESGGSVPATPTGSIAEKALDDGEHGLQSDGADGARKASESSRDEADRGA